MRNAIERADCAVRAVAVATGEDYGRTLMYFAACGRKPRSRTRWPVIHAAAKRLGYKLVDWPVDSRTVRTVVKELPERGGFIISVSGHVAGFKDGQLVDWTEGRRHRVLQVFRVEPR
jgi:hypothetical protein